VIVNYAGYKIPCEVMLKKAKEKDKGKISTALYVSKNPKLR
jgi:hypothetical protein